MKTIKVNLKNNPYEIIIDTDLFSRSAKLIKKMDMGNTGIIITNPSVYRLYKKSLDKYFTAKEFSVILVPNGEKAKTPKVFLKTLEKISKLDGQNKRIFFVCLGGGTIGDLGGFIASVYKRGKPYVQIPTTLLAQVDASIGGKNAIDLEFAKNIIGTFYQPKAVFIDPLFLKTLPELQLRQGLAEVIKYSLIQKNFLFDFLIKNRNNIFRREKTVLMSILLQCAKIKAAIVTKDEKETKGIRTILNFGHTMAHALETALNYAKITHGEAVAIGMAYAAQLSYDLGKCRISTYNSIIMLLRLYDLPLNLDINPSKVLKAFMYDKKFITGKVRMVLLRDIGVVEVVNNIKIQTIKRTVNAFLSRHT